MNQKQNQKLMLEIESRKKSLIELTQDLIRMPTVNPPCANYLEICEFLKKMALASGEALRTFKRNPTNR